MPEAALALLLGEVVTPGREPLARGLCNSNGAFVVALYYPVDARKLRDGEGAGEDVGKGEHLDTHERGLHAAKGSIDLCLVAIAECMGQAGPGEEDSPDAQVLEEGKEDKALDGHELEVGPARREEAVRHEVEEAKAVDTVVSHGQLDELSRRCGGCELGDDARRHLAILVDGLRLGVKEGVADERCSAQGLEGAIKQDAVSAAVQKLARREAPATAKARVRRARMAHNIVVLLVAADAGHNSGCRFPTGDLEERQAKVKEVEHRVGLVAVAQCRRDRCPPRRASVALLDAQPQAQLGQRSH